MAKGVINLSALLISEQPTFGTMCTPLVSTDFVETIGPAKIKINPNMTELPLVGNGFDQDASVPGALDADLSFQVPMRAAAADNTGVCGKLMKLSGMVEAEAVDGIFTYNFTSTYGNYNDATVWGYSGNLDTTGSLRQVGFNAMFAPKWTIESGKFAIMDLTTKMAFSGAAVATQPTQTKERTIPSAALGATLSIMGDSDYKVISMEIDPGQTVKLTKDMSVACGYGVSIISDRKIKFKCKVYRDIPSVVDAITAMTGKTIAALSVEYGTAPQKVKFSSDYAQITDIEQDDEDGVETWTISGLFARNDFTITMSTK